MCSVFALAFFIIYASRTIFIGNTAFGGPDSVKLYYTIFLIFHINLATIGGILGAVQIITALKDKLRSIEELDQSHQLSGSLRQSQVSQFMYYSMFYIRVEKRHH